MPHFLTTINRIYYMDFAYFIFVLVAIVVGVMVVKKITGCLIKAIILAVLVAALAYIYFSYFRV